MIAKIEQVTTTPAGDLALFVTYWENGQQVNAERHHLRPPVSRLIPYRTAEGLLERLDGVPVPENPTAEQQALAEQIGIRMEVIQFTPEQIADFAVRAASGFAAVHRRAITLQMQVATASDEQLLALAAGRAAHWSQVQQVAAENGQTAEASRAGERLALALSAAANASIAHQLAAAEIAPAVAVLALEQPWPSGSPDPRGYLQMPAVVALLDTEWEC